MNNSAFTQISKATKFVQVRVIM